MLDAHNSILISAYLHLLLLVMIVGSCCQVMILCWHGCHRKPILFDYLFWTLPPQSCELLHRRVDLSRSLVHIRVYLFLSIFTNVLLVVYYIFSVDADVLSSSVPFFQGQGVKTCFVRKKIIHQPNLDRVEFAKKFKTSHCK